MCAASLAVRTVGVVQPKYCAASGEQNGDTTRRTHDEVVGGGGGAVGVDDDDGNGDGDGVSITLFLVRCFV